MARCMMRILGFAWHRRWLGTIISAIGVSTYGAVAVTPLPWSAAEASEWAMLPLQREGQASVTIDDVAKIAYIIDLGRDGDGDKILIESRSLMDYLSDRKVEHLVVTCSHPHQDHMGGIQALFRDPKASFFVAGDLGRPRFKTISVVEDAMPKAKSLSTLYEAFASVSTETGIVFKRSSVFDAAGNPLKAFEALGLPKGEIVVSNVDYPPTLEKGEHGRSIITLFEFTGEPKHSVIDFDDAGTKAIDSAVTVLERAGKRVDAFVVPHHGSSRHDLEPIFRLNPKRAIIAVDPANRYGHPAPSILEALIDRLQGENIIFTGSSGELVDGDGRSLGSNERVVIEADGRLLARHLASDPMSYPLFVEPGRQRLERLKASPANAEQIAAADRLKEKMHILATATIDVRGPHWTDPPSAPGSPPSNTDPGRPGPGLLPPDMGPGRPGGPGFGPRPGGGGAYEILAPRVTYRGSVLSPGFEAAFVPASGLSPEALTAFRLYETPPRTGAAIHMASAEPLTPEDLAASAPRSSAKVTVLYEAPSGLPSALVAPDTVRPRSASPTRLGGTRRLPAGGMVFLDGGDIRFDGDQARLVGARLGDCAPRACLITPDGSYTLPFADVVLLREVVWRVGKGASSFYLSINPRKRLLQGTFPLSRVPSDRLRFGADAGAPQAINDVVTAGGIDRSRIGDILWRADVAFKSEALGFNVLGGAAPLAQARLYLGDSDAAKMRSDADVPSEERWCRLYWHSGAPHFALGPSTLRVSGLAIRASAEPMRPKAGHSSACRRGAGANARSGSRRRCSAAQTLVRRQGFSASCASSH